MPAAQDLVCRAVAGVWRGILLPPMRVSERWVRPVVRVLPAAAARLEAGAGPELDRSTLALWESWPDGMGDPPPAPPVRIVGFVAEGRWGQAVLTATHLCGYAPSLVVRRSRPPEIRLAEADFHGITVVVVRANGEPTVAVRGRSGPVPGAERTVAVRLLEEQMFAQLLDRDRESPASPADGTALRLRLAELASDRRSAGGAA